MPQETSSAVTSSPVGLGAAPPRSVRLRKHGQGISWGVLAFIAPHTLIGLGLVLLSVRHVVFMLACQEVPGTVVERRTEPTKNGTSYTLVVEYVAAGSTQRIEEQVSPDAYAATPEGTSYPVDVDVTLGMVHAEGALRSHAPRVLVGAVFWNALLSVFWWQAFIRPWRRRWMVMHGVAVAGELLEVTREGRGRGQRTVVRFRYTPLHARAPREGRMVADAPDLLAPGAGREVTVLHHPVRASEAIVYEAGSFEVVP